MARRLVESGVRFIQVMVPVKTGGWDHHDIRRGLEAVCPQVDRPTAGLITDLKHAAGYWTAPSCCGPENLGGCRSRRGGLVGTTTGTRSAWCWPGGGFKAGHVHGRTDDFGYKAIEDRVSPPDCWPRCCTNLGWITTG